MAAGDHLRTAAQAARRSVDEKKRQITQSIQNRDTMRRELANLENAISQYNTDVSKLEIQMHDLERQASEADRAEQRIKQDIR
jgi:uncharacterized coiled-coil DUF342 family protein